MTTQNTNGTDNLDDGDELAALFGGTAPRRDIPTPPASYTPAIERAFSEPCSKCRGTGRFTGYTGRLMGQCFACKGKGQNTFKTSPEQRASRREGARARQDRQRREVAMAETDWRAANPEASLWLEQASARGFDFAVSLSQSLDRNGTLTEAQLAAVLRCVAKDAERRQQRRAQEAAAPTIEISRIEAAFASAAANGLKRMKLRLGGFAFKPARAHPGTIYVTEGEEYLGKVVGGRFRCVPSCGSTREQAIIAAAADPEAAAVAHGQRTGTCSCCGAELTNAESIARGIGPICAEKYGW